MVTYRRGSLERRFGIRTVADPQPDDWNSLPQTDVSEDGAPKVEEIPMRLHLNKEFVESYRGEGLRRTRRSLPP
jgi:hypothetical protein